MQELGVGPGDPRVAPLVTQLHGLMREHMAAAEAARAAALPPAPECSLDLPADLADIVRDYLEICPVYSFKQATALAESEPDAGS